MKFTFWKLSICTFAIAGNWLGLLHGDIAVWTLVWYQAGLESGNCQRHLAH